MRRFNRLGAEGQQMIICRLDVLYSPIRFHTATARMLCAGLQRVQSQLISPDLKPNVERLIEIGLLTEGFDIPFLCFGQIRNTINNRTET